MACFNSNVILQIWIENWKQAEGGSYCNANEMIMEAGTKMIESW